MAPFAKVGLGAVFTAAFIGGLFQMYIGKMLRPIRHMFPPLVTGIVVLMIGVSLLGVGFQTQRPFIQYVKMFSKGPT